MNSSKTIGKLDAKNKEDIKAMENALKAKYNKNSNKPPEAENESAASA